jgi:acetylornithine deacetylase/succinyl-diaminopimelate desuccinylase-like protein
VALSLDDFTRDALPALLAFGEIPNISPAYEANWAALGHMDRAAALLVEWITSNSSGDVTLHQLDGRTPTITVEYAPTDASIDGTVVLYGHLDKQPPLGEWSEGLHPFQPVRRGDRVYARGLADDGYSTFAAILAIEAMRQRGDAHGRLVVLIEASEESGSPDLDAYLDDLAPILGQVRLLICLDSGALTYDRLWVTTSLRGNIVLDVTATVLERAQHSGSASGVVPSSFRVMRELLDRIEDPRTGEIKIPELRVAIPESHRHAAEAVAKEFGDVAGDEQPIVSGLVMLGEPGADRLLRRTWGATLSVTGVAGIPDVAVAGNVLRTHTSLTISLRTPPSVDTDAATNALVRCLTDNPPHGAHITVETGAAAGWVSPDLEPWLADTLAASSLAHFGNPVGFTGEGGSIPFLATLGQRYPGVAFVATGVLGPNSNAHGIDEMLDLPTTVNIINVISDVLTAYGKAKRHA